MNVTMTKNTVRKQAAMPTFSGMVQGLPPVSPRGHWRLSLVRRGDSSRMSTEGHARGVPNKLNHARIRHILEHVGKKMIRPP